MSEKQQYLKFCFTDKEKSIFKLYGQKNQTKISKQLNIPKSTVNDTISRVKRRAEIQGYSPDNDMDKISPDPFYVKGTSTLYDEDGNKKLQWVKTNVKLENLELVAREIVKTFIEDIENKSNQKLIKPTKDNIDYVDDLLTVYPIGDAHIGMYASMLDTDNEFNCKLAEQQLNYAINYLVDKAHPTKECVIVNLGDFVHADNYSNSTMRNSNPLDVDGRWSNVIQLAIKCLINLVEVALYKHEKVTVINEIGNHDDHTSTMLSMILAAFYNNNPRVNVDTSNHNFHYYKFHDVLIGVTHGNGVKLNDLPLLMASDKSKEWGDSKFRYWLIGHVHHINKKEYSGCVIETFRTLAGKDAWHHSNGYRAGRDMNCITYHKNYGEVYRNIINIDMIIDLIS